MPSYERPSGVKTCAYVCSRNTLAALNSVYIFIGLLLIGIAAYSKVEVMKNLSLPILGGIIACGVFLLLIAIIGVVGAIRHSQVMLFFYLIIVSLLFIVQLSVSIAALAITRSQQKDILHKTWQAFTQDEKADLQSKGDCCGFESQAIVKNSHPTCTGLKCCVNPNNTQKDPCLNCQTCYTKYKVSLEHALSVAGGVGLFFAFTLLLGIYLAVRYRNQRDPALNLDAFL
eukprot:gene3235-3715_t